jgi:hypothetical protein
MTRTFHNELLSLVGICLVYAICSNFSCLQLLSSSFPIRELEVVHQELEFVHITKTGGSTIERVGCQHGYKWGSMHYASYFGCADPDVSTWEKKKYDYTNISPWHTPPKILEKLVTDQENPFKGSKLFTVVRNPYTRFVSEFHCPHAGYKGPNKADADVMNSWIQDMVLKLQKHRNRYIFRVKNSENPDEVELNIAPHQKHFLNQVDYVYDDEGHKIIDYVVHYEEMEEEFNNLMAQHNLGVTMPKKDEMGTYGTKGPKLSFRDLDDKSIMKINQWAGADFIALGYKIIQREVEEGDYDGTVRSFVNMKYDPNPRGGLCDEFRFVDPNAGRCKRIKQ